MKCKQCGHALTANTLHCCPECGFGGETEPEGKAFLALMTLDVLVTVIILGLLVLGATTVVGWLVGR